MAPPRPPFFLIRDRLSALSASFGVPAFQDPSTGASGTQRRIVGGGRSAWKTVMVIGLGAFLVGCNRNHWAQVEVSPLPVPPGEKVLHTGRLVIAVSARQHETQCVVDEKHHPICFFQLRDALERGLARGLWPAFPEIVNGRPGSARPGDYVLQVEVTLDALRPDSGGPGWSAGARSRYRLLRDGHVLTEKTLASRSRPHFAYGAPLGEGATEVVDATIVSISQAVAAVPEARPEEPVLLPRVATRTVVDPSSVVVPTPAALVKIPEPTAPPTPDRTETSGPPPPPPPASTSAAPLELTLRSKPADARSPLGAR